MRIWCRAKSTIPLVERTVEIDKITQNPDLESDMRYLMELRKKVTGAGDKKREAEKMGR